MVSVTASLREEQDLILLLELPNHLEFKVTYGLRAIIHTFPIRIRLDKFLPRSGTIFTEELMERIEFIRFRSILGKTQSEIAQLLGVSVKAVHSYEQGWRSIPGHVQRQILLLVQRKQHVDQPSLPCWTKTACPEALRRSCPAWEFQIGRAHV